MRPAILEGSCSKPSGFGTGAFLEPTLAALEYPLAAALARSHKLRIRGGALGHLDAGPPDASCRCEPAQLRLHRAAHVQNSILQGEGINLLQLELEIQLRHHYTRSCHQAWAVQAPVQSRHTHASACPRPPACVLCT